MGGKGGRSTTTQTQTVDPDFRDRALEVFNRARSVADQPFRPYTGQRLADFTPMENRGFGNMDAFAQSAQPAIRSATDTTANIAAADGNAGLDILRTSGVPTALLDGQGMTRDADTSRALRGGQMALAQSIFGGPQQIAADINTFMNPYTQSVVDTTLADIERSRLIAQEQNNAQAVRANAFGGSRQAVQAAETDRAALEQAARTSAALRQGGFTTAANLAADANRARMSGASALGQLGATEQQLDLSQAGQLGQLGSEEGRLRLAQGQTLSQAELAQRAQQLEAAGQLAALGTTGQTAALQGAQAQLAAGGLQRAQNQAALDVQREIFMEPQQNELFRLQVLQGALGMFPNPVSTSQTQTQNPGFLGTVGGLGQTAANAALAFRLLPFCWVAREVYGLHNPRWLMFREWMLEDAPRWFRSLYIRHGAAFAEWVADKPSLKGLIRRFMDSRIAAKFGEPR